MVNEDNYDGLAYIRPLRVNGREMKYLCYAPRSICCCIHQSKLICLDVLTHNTMVIYFSINLTKPPLSQETYHNK